MTVTTTPPASPILLNVTSHAGFGVEWMMPDTGGTAMQLVNPRGTHYLLFALLAPYSADWLTMGVINPQRFGLRGPAATFDEFLPVAHAFIAAINDTTDVSDNGRYPRVPCPRDPNEEYRRQQSASPARSRGPLLSRLAKLRAARRPGAGRHRLDRHRGRRHRPTAPMSRELLIAS